MTLEDLGYNEKFENYRNEHKLRYLIVGRVILQHKESYIVKTENGEFAAEVNGQMRFAAESPSDFPAVGDWVLIAEYDEKKALIHAILPRETIIERRAVGKLGEKQIIAVNIDYAFIVQAVDRDFNINRIERYLTICNSSGVKPVIILSKIDLINETDLQEILNDINQRIQHIPILTVDNKTGLGYDKLKFVLDKGKTYCLLGSSGVGKSTLLNNLIGQTVMKTDSISLSTNRGKHVTSHRELVVLENGGILIDNPGMREVGIANATNGLGVTFETIERLASSCKFRDCQHKVENGCAVLEALKNGEIDQESYDNYQKMVREKNHFASTVAQKREKDKKFGKMVKKTVRGKSNNKYFR